MEIITGLPKAPACDRRSLLSFDSPQELWTYAKGYVAKHRQSEFDSGWNPVVERAVTGVSEEAFFRELLWVCYVSGFSARVISKLYERLLVAHNIICPDGVYIPAKFDKLVGTYQDLERRVYPIFKNKNKAKAVQEARFKVASQGWAGFYDYFVKTREPRRLGELYGVGPVLACHLARNLGNIAVVKPDLHLNRLVAHLNNVGTRIDDSHNRYEPAIGSVLDNARELCAACAALEDPPWPLGKVDLTLWLAAVDCGTK